MSKKLPPRKLPPLSLEQMHIPVLVGHLRTHEEWARRYCETKEQYQTYHDGYLGDLYQIGHRRNTEGFSLELLVARVDEIPFKYKLKKGQTYAAASAQPRISVDGKGESHTSRH